MERWQYTGILAWRMKVLVCKKKKIKSYLAVCCSPAPLSIYLAAFFQVSAWLAHWSIAQPNTRLCLFNNRAQSSVNSYSRAALTKHDSDRQSDWTSVLQDCSNSPFTATCPLKPQSCHSALSETLEFCRERRQAVCTERSLQNWTQRVTWCLWLNVLSHESTESAAHASTCACTCLYVRTKSAVCEWSCVVSAYWVYVYEWSYRKNRGDNIKILIVSEGLSSTMQGFIRRLDCFNETHSPQICETKYSHSNK